MRDKFIKKIAHIDDFYYANCDVYRTYADNKIRNNEFSTYKECFKTSKKGYPLSHINIRKIKEITLKNDLKTNPFIIFYEVDNDVLKKLFDSLATTHKALNYYYAYAEKMRDLKMKDTHKNISRKIQDVIDFIRETDIDVEESIQHIISNGKQREGDSKKAGNITFEYLHNLKGSLSNSHYTKRQLYQNFLFEVSNILEGKTYKNKKISKAKIINIVNSIIAEYFDDEDRFTVKTDISKFKTQKYIYETMEGITLTHGNR